MTAKDLVEAPLQSHSLKRTSVFQNQDFVVKGNVRCELRVQPNLLLRKRQGERDPGWPARDTRLPRPLRTLRVSVAR